MEDQKIIEEPSTYAEAIFLVNIIEANPFIEIQTPDINGLIREVRSHTGVQIRSKPYVEEYEVYVEKPHGGYWVNTYKRVHPRRFIVYIEN